MDVCYRRKRMAVMFVLILSFACSGKGKQVSEPSITSFTASPSTPIPVGAKATLKAVFDGGDGVVQPGAIAVKSGFPVDVSPTSNTTYTLQVTSSSNMTVSATAVVVVDTTSTTVGPGGAVIQTPAGASVSIPFGAVDKPTPITVSATPEPPPPGIEARGPVYRFEPAGMLFSRPIQVSLPLPSGATTGAIYWSRLGTSDFSSFDSIGGIVAAGSVTAEAPHFSLAVIGQAAPTRTGVGVGQTTWISATTRDSEPVDFASQGVEALVNDGSGTLASIPGVGGTGAQAGTFVISGVPNGEYMLHSGTQYLVTSTSSPDLGTQKGGRLARLRAPLTAA